MSTHTLHRTSDPETSIDAASHVDETGARAEVLWLLSIEPLADHELYARYEADSRMVGDTHLFTPQRLRTARAELVATGKVQFAEYYRLTPTGGRTRVWSLT